MADQVGVAGLVAVLVTAGLGAALGRWRGWSVWAPEPLLAALAVVAVVFATLPDTEGSTLVGAALVPVAGGALVRRTVWHGTAAGAAIAAVTAATAVVAIDGAAGRAESLVVALVAGLVCAVLVVLVLRVLGIAPAAGRGSRRVTSGPGRPSP